MVEKRPIAKCDPCGQDMAAFPQDDHACYLQETSRIQSGKIFFRKMKSGSREFILQAGPIKSGMG